MSWYDVEDTLFDGTEEEMNKLSCPDCGGVIKVKYDAEVRGMQIECKDCGHIERSSGGDIPNFYNIFEKEKTFDFPLQS